MVILIVMFIIVSGIISFIVNSFNSSKDCSQIVIDTNEVHSGIDIPKVESINCYFDQQARIRVSVYKLKLSDLDLNKYISKYGFKLVNSNLLFDPRGLKISEQPSAFRLYQVAGIQSDNKWKYTIEVETKTLWVEIIYDL